MSDKKPLLKHQLPVINERGNPEKRFIAPQQIHEMNWGCYSCMHYVIGEPAFAAWTKTRDATAVHLIQNGEKPEKAIHKATQKLTGMHQQVKAGRMGLCRNFKRPDIGELHWVPFNDACHDGKGGSYYEARAKADGPMTTLPIEEMTKRGLI